MTLLTLCISSPPRQSSSLSKSLGRRPGCRRPATVPASTASSSLSSLADDSECDVVVIGSGIGGLSCASLLAKYGLTVTVLESHTIPGGAAHSWQRQGYHFESGPSLYSGMASRGPAANPLSLVLQAIGEPLDLLTYDDWNVFVPEVPLGVATGVGPNGFDNLLVAARGPEVLAAWRKVQESVRPLAVAATALPPLAIRLDPGVVVSAVGRYLPSLAASLTTLPQLTGPFSAVLDRAEQTVLGQPLDPFIRNYLDLLCFLLSGLPAEGTLTAEMAFMMKEWFDPGAALEFPRGGSQAMVDALVRGVTKRGGNVVLGAHVEGIDVDKESGKAVGVRLRGGKRVRATRAVVSNAATPDTLRMLPADAVPDSWRAAVGATPLNPSFVHLHLGFDATGLEVDKLDLHHIVVRSWAGGVTAPHNVVLISIPSVVDASLAPPGKHTLHAYYPATEPWEVWEGVQRGSEEYLSLKEERAAALWAAVERVIPDIRRRVEIEMVGTPHTHARFLRRSGGSYGPAWAAGQGTFPFGTTPVKGLYCCGDYTFPGIGLPAVAASGAIVANTLVPLRQHLELLDSIGL